jgi:surface antigen
MLRKRENNQKMKSNIYQKILLVLASLVMLLPSVAMADQFDEQIKQLNNQINQNQGTVNQKSAEANTLSNKVSILSGQISISQAALVKTQVEVAQSQSKLKQIEQDLNHQKDLLRANVRLIYKKGETSEMELLASSDNLSDFVGRQQSMQNIKDKISDNLAKITALKKAQEDENTRLTNLASQQKTQNDALNSQRSEQQDLLTQTKGEESKYQQIVAQKKQELSAVYAARASYDASNNVSVSSGGSVYYPWANATPDGGVDPWGFLYRECVSYVAWKRRAVGKAPYPDHWGNAGSWVTYANSSTPAPGAIAVFPPGVGGAGYIGHVAYVESVNGNGTFNLSEYNWHPYSYTYRSGVSSSGVRFIY